MGQRVIRYTGEQGMAAVVTLNPEVKSFKDLMVWQQSRLLVKQVYVLTQQFPKEELYGLTNQMRRSAVSVPSNIAEGHARDALKEYLRHLSIAVASLAELQTQLILCEDLGYAAPEQLANLHNLADKTFRMLKNLQKSLREKLPVHP